MKCTKCSHHFCWICLKPFNRETGHDDFYKCAIYTADSLDEQPTEVELQQVKSNQYLQKLGVHQHKFDACKADRRKAIEVLYRLRSRTKTVHLLGNTSWLVQTIENICETYRLLQWSHVCSYFMAQCNQKEIFRQQQETVEYEASKVLELLTGYSIEQIADMGGEINKKMRSLLEHCARMAEDLSANFDNILQYAPDLSTSEWACVACGATNPDRYAEGSRSRVLSCAKCNACRAHGEPDCRVPKCGLKIKRR